jgi:hypothetical protein
MVSPNFVEDGKIGVVVDYDSVDRLRTRLRTASGKGKTPIRRLWIIGHGSRGIAAMAQRSGANMVVVDDLWKGHRDNPPATDYASAQKGEFEAGLCWFAANAEVRLIGCGTLTAAESWAKTILRRGARAFGTQRDLLIGADAQGVWLQIEGTRQQHRTVASFHGGDGWEAYPGHK